MKINKNQIACVKTPAEGGCRVEEESRRREVRSKGTTVLRGYPQGSTRGGGGAQNIFKEAVICIISNCPISFVQRTSLPRSPLVSGGCPGDDEEMLHTCSHTQTSFKPQVPWRRPWVENVCWPVCSRETTPPRMVFETPWLPT